MTLPPAMDREAANDAPARALPHNIEAEQALLGAIMYDNGAIDRADDLEPEHFFEPFHGRLFAEISNAVRVGRSAEPILLADKLQGDPAFHELDGLRYLADLVDRAPPAVNAGDYAKAIRDTAKRRALIRIGEIMITEAEGNVEKPMTAEDQVERAESELFALAEKKGSKGGFQPFSAAMKEFMGHVLAAYSSPGGVGGIPTYLADLDAKVGGLFPSDLIILAGRPSMGKTALATNIAFNIARRFVGERQEDGSVKAVSGGRVGFYSLEMSKGQLAGRIIADVAGVSTDCIRKNQISENEIARMRDVESELEGLPIYIDDGGGTSIGKIMARARRLKRQLGGLELIVVDYLQLATASTEARRGGRVQEISEITMGLKALAKELDCPVIALSQLSRQVEQRDDKRPQLSDLRESGSIEQDADMVWFVYREAYYVGRAEPRSGTPEHQAWQDAMDLLEGLAEVIVAKQRHGPIGTVRLAFNSDYTRFTDLAREQSFAHARDRGPSKGSPKYVTHTHRDDND